MQKTQLKQSSKQSLVNKKTILLCISGILFLLLLTSTFFFIKSYFLVQQVIINQTNTNLRLQGIGGMNGTNLLLLNSMELEEHIYKSNSYIKSVSVSKKYPSTVAISVSLYQPTAKLEVSEGYFILSSDGRILKKTKGTSDGLTVLHYYEKLSYDGYQSGGKVSFKDIKASLDFLQKARDIGLSINSIDIHGFNMIALNTEKQKILFSLDKSQRDQLYQFERVIHQLKIQGKQFKVLDLRFERVVIEN